jgi:hypothetical protein
MVPAGSENGEYMNATRTTGMNEIRALSAIELDAVSGGTAAMMYNFTVAGMRIWGYGAADGNYGVQVEYGNKYIQRDGKV